MAVALLLPVPPSPPLRLRRTIRSIFAKRAKRNLLELISDQDRGLRTQKDATKRDAIVKAIESMASSAVTTGESISGTWRLLWTTEKEQLFIIEKAGLFGTSAGDVLQVIDVEKRKLNNVITFPPDGVFFVRSDIDIASPQRVNFRFQFRNYKQNQSDFDYLRAAMNRINQILTICVLIIRFTSAVLRARNWEIPLPPFGQGWFENVYLDDEIRVAKDIRGDYLVVDRAPYHWKK